MIKKIGFACKISEFNSKQEVVSIPEYNFKSTTISWLNRQSKDVAVEKLWELLHHNIESAKSAVSYIGKLKEPFRMFRLGSDCMPAYSHADWKWFWQQLDVQAYCEQELIKVGDIARNTGVRLSFHPGPFVVLASETPDIVNRSIEEFEYHADMARWMGYGRTFQDFKINVHISGRLGPDGIRSAYPRLSNEARNCITIENEENSWGLDDCLSISDIVPIVLDVHHNWCREGEYIDPNSDRVKRVRDSWRGVRPVMHYSVSRANILVDHCPNTLPDMSALLDAGYKKQKLRAHSDFYWNTAVNEWALSFQDYFDIMCESKGKNIAAHALLA
jgi:UV DNA damage endonuclease